MLYFCSISSGSSLFAKVPVYWFLVYKRLKAGISHGGIETFIERLLLLS